MEDLEIYVAIIGSGILTIITIVIIIKTIVGWIIALIKPPDRPWETKKFQEERKEKYKRGQEALEYLKNMWRCEQGMNLQLTQAIQPIGTILVAKYEEEMELNVVIVEAPPIFTYTTLSHFQKAVQIN